MNFYFVYLIFSISLAVAYKLIMLRYVFFWKKLPEWTVPNDFAPTTFVSVLVAARNEAENIESCIKSIFQQNYPTHLFEIIVIDDHSNDSTAAVVRSANIPNLRLLALKDFLTEGDKNITSFKKKAIEIGISQAKGDWIVCTDADCTMNENWLSLIVSFFEQKKLQFVAAPVCFWKEKTALERFQSLDFLGMMGVAGAGVEGKFMSMCNGANLAYSKAAFYAVGGFGGIDRLASGDDMMLMQKISKKFPTQIGFLKNPAAATFTFAKPTLRSFFQQRIRWASKSSSYDEKKVTLLLAIVFFFCCNIFLSGLLAVFFTHFWTIFLFQILVKAAIDFIFLQPLARYFHRSDLLQSFFTSFLLHTAYIVSVGTLANFSQKYEWKGRRVR